MAKIELEIVANNEQYVSKIKEVEAVTDDLAKKRRKHWGEEKGIIESIIEGLDELQEKRKKANDPKAIEYYNKKIAEARSELTGFNKLGVQQEKTVAKTEGGMKKLLGTVGKMVLGYVTITAAIKVFNNIMNATQKTGDFLKRELTGLRFAVDQLWQSIAQGNMEELGKRMGEARQAGRDYADSLDYIGDLERQLAIEESRRSKKLAELAAIWRNTAATDVKGSKERADAAEEYIQLTIEGADAAKKFAIIRRDAELKATAETSGLTQEEILLNLERAETYKTNEDAIKSYLESVKNLASASVSKGGYVTPQGVTVGATPADPEAMKKFQAEIDNTSDATKKLTEEWVNWGNVGDDQRKRITAAIQAVDAAEARGTSATIRANIQKEMALGRLENAEDDSAKKRIETEEKFAAEVAKLYDEYLQGQITMLEGPERIEAERLYQLKQVENLKIHLEEMGTLTQEHLDWLAGLEDAINSQSALALAKYNKETLDEEIAANEAIQKARKERLGLDYELEQSALDLVKDNAVQKLEVEKKYLELERAMYIEQGGELNLIQADILANYIEAIKQQIEAENAKKALPSVWKLFGLDPEGDEVDALKEGVDIMLSNIVGMLDSMYSERVADAQRNRELIDDQIGYTQKALDQEIELMKLGYANNVAAKQKEIAQLEEQRKKAIEKEQKAIKAQKRLDSIVQLSSLITASANIWKTTSTIIPPFGQILAIAAIATMFAAFASSKVRAAKATKLAKGGVGTVEGRSHAEGGEPFLSHVEIERGETWGVLNKRASQKYGGAFREMVNSFNKDMVPVVEVGAGNVIVDVNQTNERLDRLEYQLVKLNSNFGVKKEVQDHGSYRIEKTGNKTRIIRKNAL